MKAGDAEAFGGEEGLEAGEVVFAVGGDEAVGVAGPVLHFAEGVGHAEGDGFGAVGAASGEAGAEFAFAGGHDEEVDAGALDVGVGAAADLVGTLDIDVHDDVAAGLEVGDDFGFEGAVEVAVDGGVFEEIACLESLLEVFAGEEVVVFAVFFAWAGGAGGAGDGVADFSGIGEATAEGGFARAGGA